MGNGTSGAGIGAALSVIAVGAILKFAVSATTHGFNIQSVGLILMIAGGIGLVIALFALSRSSSDVG